MQTEGMTEIRNENYYEFLSFYFIRSNKDTYGTQDWQRIWESYTNIA